MRVIALALLVACSSQKDQPKSEKVEDMVAEASVDWARQQLPEIDKRLASADPGSASSPCAVIKPDMAKIRAADPELAKTLEVRCGRDVAVRSMTVAVERAEKDRFDCSAIPIYEKSIAKANAGADPEVAKLRERVAAACPKR
jgi:hypothetical protein